MTIALSLKSKGGFLSLIDFWFISLEKSTDIYGCDKSEEVEKTWCTVHVQ